MIESHEFVAINYRKCGIISIVTLICFFLYNIMGNFIPFVMGLLFLLYISLLMPHDESFLCLIFLSPSLAWIKVLSNTFAIFGYMLLTFELRYLTSKRKVYVDASTICLLAVGLITAFFNDTISAFFPIVRTAAFFVFLSTYLRKESKMFSNCRKGMVLCYVYGIGLNLLFGIFYYLLKHQNILNGYFGGIRNDRNYFAALLAIGISIIVALIIDDERNYNTNPFIMSFCVLLFFIFGVITASRTFVLSILIILIFLIISPGISKKAMFLAIVVALGIIVVLLFGDAIFEAIDHVMSRFDFDDLRTGNGRLDAWSFYLKESFQDPIKFLFGYGNPSKVLSSGKYNIVAHNTFIQTFYNVGLFGLAFYSMCFAKVGRCLNTAKRKRIIMLLPLFITLFEYMTIDAAFSDSFNISIFISLALLPQATPNN